MNDENNNEKDVLSIKIPSFPGPDFAGTTRLHFQRGAPNLLVLPWILDLGQQAMLA